MTRWRGISRGRIGGFIDGGGVGFEGGGGGQDLGQGQGLGQGRGRGGVGAIFGRGGAIEQYMWMRESLRQRR